MNFSYLELFAIIFTTASIWLAARNNILTWSTGIIGSLLFGVLFYQSKLYADVTLPVFFIVTSISGWLAWSTRNNELLPITSITPKEAIKYGTIAILATASYGSLLHFFTDAYAPFIDSAVLALSVLGQFLLINRKLQAWIVWLLVNTLSVPLYFSRGLDMTALLYVVYWFNAIYGYYSWNKQKVK